MISSSFLSLPVDPDSAARLAGHDLRLALVDTSDAQAFSAWLQADSRGFHGPRQSPESLASQVDGVGYRRTTGVWDDADAPAPAAEPVATVSSWPTELTVPGGTSVTAWAISAVTVSPTHRRRGIARALLEAELRAANTLGVPLAMLTVSEATIYGRYGFAPAASTADWRIDTRRAKWAGPDASGRLSFITLAELREQGPALIERIRLDSPGEIEQWGHRWDQRLGLAGDGDDLAKKLRAVRYVDAGGETQGFAVFTVTESAADFAEHVLDVHYLVTATDDAYAGLWRFVLEMDLVSTVTAPLRAVDEAFAFQVTDIRAVRKTHERDHLWTRILDVPAALDARRYATPGRFVLEVTDPLGYAGGRFLLEIAADGSASTTVLGDEVPDDAAGVSLTVNDLSALYLGGVSAVLLARAGRIVELRPGSAVAVETAFRSPVTPWLSIWF